MADKQNETALLEARAKLAEKFGDQSRLGGKGSQRRKKKAVHKTQVTDDKKLKPIIKKFGVQPLPGIDEVNMFKDDNTVLNFKHPEGYFKKNLRFFSL
jgi:nascent polypeptide-associated complex subunit beta